MRTSKACISVIIALVILLGFTACDNRADPHSTTALTEHKDGTVNSDHTTTEHPPETTSASGGTKLRVLFLGNSLTYYNDMPALFESLAKSAGKDIFVDSVTKGSATMSLFADKTSDIGASAYAKLTKNKWDYVIIQPSRRITPYENSVLEAEIAAAKSLSELAKGAGAEILLYTTWGNNNGSLTVYKAISASETQQLHTESIKRAAHTLFMRETAEKIAKELGGVLIIDAGYAFENVIATNPEINLYDPDLRHPSREGSYLAACTVFATIYGEKTQGGGYTASIKTADILQKAADDTVLNKLVPDLKDDGNVVSDKEFNLLVVGSNLLDNYSMLSILGDIMTEADGVTLNATSYLDSTFVFAMMAEEATDLGVRKALQEKEWDAIIIQLSRRNTASATDVAQNEKDSLAKIMPLFLAQTENVFILTLNSADKPAIFSAANNKKTYDKTAMTETYSAQEGSVFFSGLAGEMAISLGCDTILYGEAYHMLTSPTKEEVGYLQACCLYNTLFGKEIPEAITVTNGLSAADAAKVRSIAKECCLK